MREVEEKASVSHIATFMLMIFAIRMGKNMSAWSFWDWFSYGGIVVAALIMAAKEGLKQWSTLRKRVPTLFLKPYWAFIPSIALVISAAAFTRKQLEPTDFFLPSDAKIGSPFGVVQAWGLDNGAFYMIVKTSTLNPPTNLRKLVLVIRAAYSDVDKMTDTHIVKSQSYTILEGFMTLAIAGGGGLRVLRDRPTPIEFDLVEIPSIYSPDKINSLSDAEIFGGKLLASTAVSLQFQEPLPPASPQEACPPPPKSPPGSPRKT